MTNGEQAITKDQQASDTPMTKDAAKKLTHILYALYAASFLLGITGLFAIIINYLEFRVSNIVPPYSLQTANPPKTTDNHWLSVKKYCKFINVKITRVILCRNLRFEVNPRGLNRKFLFKCPR